MTQDDVIDMPNDVTEESSGGKNSRAISEAFQTPETVNLTEKIESVTTSNTMTGKSLLWDPC